MAKQWPVVYHLCHTFLHVMQLKKHCHARIACPQHHPLGGSVRRGCSGPVPHKCAVVLATITSWAGHTHRQHTLPLATLSCFHSSCRPSDKKFNATICQIPAGQTSTSSSLAFGTTYPMTEVAVQSLYVQDQRLDNCLWHKCRQPLGPQWLHTLLFPLAEDYEQSSTAQHYLQALWQYCLGIC